MRTNGQVIIGGDGTNTMGFVPPSGCRIRIPNILGRQTLGTGAGDSANFVPNATLGTRPDFTTTAAGEIDFEFFMNDWYHLFASAFKVRMINCATMDTHVSSNEASPTEINEYAVGVFQAAGILALTNNSLGGTITNMTIARGEAASNGHSVSLTGCTGYTINGLRNACISNARNSGRVTLSQCRNFTFNNLQFLGGTALSLSTCANMQFNNTDYCDRIIGTTNVTGPLSVFTLAVSCDNIFIDGITIGLNGAIANVHPYTGYLASSNCSNVTMRNGGTFANRIGGATNAPGVIFTDSGNNDTFRIQRMYLTATRSTIATTVNTSKNITLEHCYGTTGDIVLVSNNTIFKALRAASNLTTAQSSVYGTHWLDMFTTDTAGRIALRYNEPTLESASQYEAVSLGVGAGFTSAGQLSMPNVGDEVIFTMPYFSLGHTALANTAPTITGAQTGNFQFSYDLDTGNGFSGTFQTLNAANLSAETISASTGFRLRIRAVVTVANTANALTTIQVVTVSTATAQEDNLYPLDTATISLTGLTAGSRVQLCDVTNDAELFNGIVSGTTLSYASPFVGNYTVRVRIMFANTVTANEFVEFSDTVTINGLTRNIVPVVDSVYVANGVDGTGVTGITIVDATDRIEIEGGTYTWQQIYAYETTWLATEVGIRDNGRGIRAIDTSNYIITTSRILNTSSPTVPLIINNGWGRDSVTEQTVTLIDTSGGTVFSNPDLVIPFAVGSGLSPSQDAALTAIKQNTDLIPATI
jgi:hypothetical protein